MYLSNDFAFYFISPWVDFRPFGGFAYCRIIRIMPPSFGRNQLRNVTHDLVTDLIELCAVLLSMSLCFERTERLADVDLDPGAASTLEAGENVIEADQAHG